MYEYLGFCPEGVGASGGYDGCDGLRSGPEIRPRFARCTVDTGFTAGSRQFASKLAPTEATLCEHFTGFE
ncbi:hypothetical protein B0B36_14255 [Pseudomonas syringae pv. actinidifoliorum]|nr:hypothetical protein B0B36_14255 [Pseudomonas syringae pv. actinidifoliorum]